MAADHAEKTASSWRMHLIIGVAVILTSAVLALALFVFVLRPWLEGDTGKPVPMGEYFAVFTDLQVTGLPNNRDEIQPILQVTITLACESQPTLELVERLKPYFQDMLVELYSAKTRSQLSDPFEKEILREEARRKANDLIGQLAPGFKGRVMRVLHSKYLLVEQ